MGTVPPHQQLALKLREASFVSRIPQENEGYLTEIRFTSDEIRCIPARGFSIVNRNAVAWTVRTDQYHDSQSNHVRRAHRHGIDSRRSPSGTGTTIDGAAFIPLHNRADC